MSNAIREAPDKGKCRFIYDSNGNIKYIREFSEFAKLGQYVVDITEFVYDLSGNIISIIPRKTKDAVNHDDLLVPEKPIITSCIGPGLNPTLSGTCTGDNGNIIYVYVNNVRLVSVGVLAANAFSFSLDLTHYLGTVSIKVKVENTYGLSEDSNEISYII